MNGETNPDDSNQNGNNSDDGGDSQRRVSEKAKVRWETDLQLRFLEAMEYLGQHKAVPKKILEFMNVDGITRAHVASHLQKYRKYLKRLKQRAREAEMSRRAMNTNFASSSYFNPQGSYINTSLNMDNLFQSQLDYGLGQSNLILNNNNSINYMHHGRPIYDLSQTRSNLLPMGGSLGFFSSVLPLNEERRSVFATPQVSRVQYGTPNDVLGMNSNRGTGYMRSNYAGISIDANGNLVGLGGARVNGNGNGSLGESFGAMNWNFNNNNMSNNGLSTLRVPSTFSSSLANEGQTQSNLIAQMDGGVPRSIFETSQIPRFGQYGTTNDVYYDGINTNEYGDLIGLGGARGKGNVNGSLGENVGTMNWNFNNNNMTNHGSSTSRFSSPFSSFFVNEDQSQSNLNAQTDGLVPILENLSMCNYHHDIGNTINSQFDQNQHQGQVSAGVPKLSNDVLLESNAISNWNFNNQHQGQVSAANPKLSNNVLLERNAISNWNFDNHQGQASAGNLELSNDVFLERDAINNWSFDNHQGQVSAGNPELSNDVLLERNAISNWSFNNHHGQVSAGGNPKLSNDILHEKNAINNWSFDNHQGQVSAGNPELSNDVLLEKNAVNNWSFNNHQGQVNAGNSELANDVLLERNAISNWSFDNHQGQMNVEKLELANDVLFEKNATSNWNFGNHQGQVNAGNSELANDVLLERNAIRNWSFDNHQGQMNAGNPELANSVLFERNATSNWNFGNVNDNPNEEMLNSIAANSEMYIPTPDMNTINQEHGVADLAEFPWLPIDPDGIDGDFMNYMLDDDVML